MLLLSRLYRRLVATIILRQPEAHASTPTPGVHIMRWRALDGARVVVGIGPDGRSVTEHPRTAHTPAELAAVIGELSALVYASADASPAALRTRPTPTPPASSPPVLPAPAALYPSDQSEAAELDAKLRQMLGGEERPGDEATRLVS